MLLPWRRGLILVAMLLPLGCGRKPATVEEAPLSPVQAESPRLLTLAEWTDVLGTTQPLPNRAARVAAAVEGRVLLFPEAAQGGEGHQVQAGDVIAKLDSRLIEERKKQAETAVRLAQVDVTRLEALMRPATAAASVPLVSPIEVEKAKLTLEDAVSRRQALDEELKLYTLRAPIAGRLGLLQVVPGQTVPVGTTIAEIVDLQEIDVLCFVPPHAAARLGLDQPARLVRVKDNGKNEVSAATGKVVFIAVQAQPETGNFAVKVRFPNAGLELRSSTVVRLQVQTKAEEARLTIPTSALMEDSDPPTVVVVEDLKPVANKEGKEEERGKARRLRIRLGVRDANEQRVEVLGLENDKKEPVPIDSALFVVKGAYGLQDGDPVKLEQEDDD